MKELQEILITPEAQTLLERILASCISRDNTKEEIKFSDKSSSLLDFFKRYPSPATSLAAFCKQENRKEVGRKEIIELFSGPIHAKAVKDWVINPNIVIVGTLRPFIQRLEELEISLESLENKATFTLFDLATAGRVLSRTGRMINLRTLEVEIRNYVLPENLQVQKDDWVLAHMGAVITELSEEEVGLIHKEHQRFNDKFILERIKEQLKGKALDCQKFCPSKKSHSGFNLSKWNLDRL